MRLNSTALNFLLGVNFVLFFCVLLFQYGLSIEFFLIEDFILLGGLAVDSGNLVNLQGLITTNFFHIDIIHFFMNMYSLQRIGSVVQEFYSDKKIFSTYIISGLGGSLLSVFFYVLSGSTLLTLGASASIFGLVGLLLGGAIKKHRFGSDLPFTIQDILPVIMLSLLVGLIPGLRVNNLAHIGGVATGVALGLILAHDMTSLKTNFDKAINSVLYYFSVFCFVVAYTFLLLNFFAEIY